MAASSELHSDRGINTYTGPCMMRILREAIGGNPWSNHALRVLHEDDGKPVSEGFPLPIAKCPLRGCGGFAAVEFTSDATGDQTTCQDGEAGPCNEGVTLEAQEPAWNDGLSHPDEDLGDFLTPISPFPAA